MRNTILDPQGCQPPTSGWLSGLTLVVFGGLSCAAIGCGQNPVPAANQGGIQAASGNFTQAAIPGVPSPADQVLEVSDEEKELASQAGIHVVQPQVDRPAAQTGLVRGLTQMLNSTPLEDEQKDSILSQMEQADKLLHDAKQRNRGAIREAGRQVRVRGASSPNIVLIVADDLCLSDLSCYGPSEIQTPNIDSLVKSGTRFTQSYAASPVSQDARWCLVTGRRPDQATTHFEATAALEPEDVTMAEVMWQAGYTTGVYGHWGVMTASGPATPEGHGYSEWLGTYGPADEPQPYPEFVTQRGNKLRLLKNADGKQGQYVQDFFVSEAAEFLSRNIYQRPVFLQVFFSVPGTRRTVPVFDQYADKPWPDAVKIRAAAISRMDNDIGKLMRRLQDLKQLSNTVFILTSDTSGDSVPVPTASPNGALVLRGHHGDLYEGGLRVPLIISGTAMIPAGKTAPVVTAAWDLAPTIYHLAQVAKIPPIKQGQTLLPQLKANAQMPERFLKWEPRHGSAGVAARWKDWKAVRLAGSAQVELYDLKSDPSESQDIAKDHPDVVAEILARLSPVTNKVAANPR